MEENRLSYLEKETEATITKEKGQHIFLFQKAKIKLKDQLEIGMIALINDPIDRVIEETEDELKLVMKRPKTILNFNMLRRKTTYAKWLFAHKLIRAVEAHSYQRLNLIVCPDNIVFDRSFNPMFLHYGVKESVPPYSEDPDKLLLEVKATVSELIDDSHTFHEYYHFHTTLSLNPLIQEIFTLKSLSDLADFIGTTIVEIEKREKALVHLPKKKWLTQKYSLIAVGALLLPLIVYSIYSFFFVQPKQEAFIQSSEAFLTTNYSEVINQLNHYNAESMPYVTQYQLATSYVEYESLTEDQRNTIQNTLTLQSDERYFTYWIHIGRGENEEAVDLARSLEDRDLVMLGLLKYREDIKADDRLSGQEKEEELQVIQNEIDEYMKEREELEAQEEAEVEQEEPASESEEDVETDEEDSES